MSEELKSAIRDSLEEYVSGDGLIEASAVVYSRIRKDVGATQEKLFLDLQATRTERDAAQRREQALIETVERLQEENSNLRRQLIEDGS